MRQVNWVWKAPLLLAALGYVSTFLLWGSHTSTQCIGFKGIALLVTLAVLAGVIAVIVIGLGDTGRKLIKSTRRNTPCS